MNWTNPHGVDLSQPFLYMVRISADSREHLYIGKATSRSRLNAYSRNIERAQAGLPKRANRSGYNPANERYRFVHLAVASAMRAGWRVEHFPLCNVPKADLNRAEREAIARHRCDLNGGPSWLAGDFDRLAEEFIAGGES